MSSPQTPVLCDNLEGWDGLGGGGRFEREGTHVYLGLIHADVWQKPIQYCKAITLQLKINRSKNKHFWSLFTNNAVTSIKRFTKAQLAYWDHWQDILMSLLKCYKNSDTGNLKEKKNCELPEGRHFCLCNASFPASGHLAHGRCSKNICKTSLNFLDISGQTVQVNKNFLFLTGWYGRQ